MSDQSSAQRSEHLPHSLSGGAQELNSKILPSQRFRSRSCLNSNLLSNVPSKSGNQTIFPSSNLSFPRENFDNRNTDVRIQIEEEDPDEFLSSVTPGKENSFYKQFTPSHPTKLCGGCSTSSLRNLSQRSCCIQDQIENKHANFASTSECFLLGSEINIPSYNRRAAIAIDDKKDASIKTFDDSFVSYYSITDECSILAQNGSPREAKEYSEDRISFSRNRLTNDRLHSNPECFLKSEFNNPSHSFEEMKNVLDQGERQDLSSPGVREFNKRSALYQNDRKEEQKSDKGNPIYQVLEDESQNHFSRRNKIDVRKLIRIDRMARAAISEKRYNSRLTSSREVEFKEPYIPAPDYDRDLQSEDEFLMGNFSVRQSFQRILPARHTLPEASSREDRIEVDTSVSYYSITDDCSLYGHCGSPAKEKLNSIDSDRAMIVNGCTKGSCTNQHGIVNSGFCDEILPYPALKECTQPSSSQNEKEIKSDVNPYCIKDLFGDEKITVHGASNHAAEDSVPSPNNNEDAFNRLKIDFKVTSNKNQQKLDLSYSDSIEIKVCKDLPSTTAEDSRIMLRPSELSKSSPTQEILIETDNLELVGEDPSARRSRRVLCCCKCRASLFITWLTVIIFLLAMLYYLFNMQFSIESPLVWLFMFPLAVVVIFGFFKGCHLC